MFRPVEHSNFSQEFLTQHYDVILLDIFHQIKALFLYPPHCSCAKPCQCDDFREKIVLSLNLEFFHKAQEKNTDHQCNVAMRYLLNIPEDSFLKYYFTQAYPLWLIQENFQKKRKSLRIVDRLIWTLLRLIKSWEAFRRVIRESW